MYLPRYIIRDLLLRINIFFKLPSSFLYSYFLLTTSFLHILISRQLNNICWPKHTGNLTASLFFLIPPLSILPSTLTHFFPSSHNILYITSYPNHNSCLDTVLKNSFLTYMPCSTTPYYYIFLLPVYLSPLNYTPTDSTTKMLVQYSPAPLWPPLPRFSHSYSPFAIHITSSPVLQYAFT